MTLLKPKIAFIEFLDSYATLNFPSFGVAQIRAHLKEKGFSFSEPSFTELIHRENTAYDIFLRNIQVGKEEKENTFRKIAEKLGLFDINILCAGYTWSKTITRFNEFLQFLKANTGVLIIAGGLLSACKDLAGNTFDCLLNGLESPSNLAKILDEYPSRDSWHKLSGMLFRDENSGEIIETKIAEPTTVYPTSYNYHDLVLKNHLLMNSCNSTQKEYFNVFATQPLLVSLGNGCSNACPFCVASCSPLVERSPKEFVRDVIKINNETGHRYFFIGHWNVSRNEAFMEELITALEEIEEELLFGISIEAKSFLKPEHFRRLKKAGCVKIDFGIETASPRLMKIYRKNSSREVIQDAIKMAHDAGLFVGGNIICSLPGETDEDFEQTVEFCRPLSKYIHRWLVNTFILFEHSIVYKRPEKFDVKIKEPYVNSSVDLTKAQNCSTYTAYYYDWKTANSEEYQRKSLQKQNLFFSEVDKQLRFSFAGYDYLHSLEKVDQLIKYAEDMVSISLGLGSNQNLLEMRTPVESKQRFAEFEYLHHLINERIRYDKEEKRTKLLLIGGEPLIHPEIFRILKMIKKNNFEAVIRTNARMLANERFCEILGKFCEEILVVDPANEKEAYEKISQVPGSWDQSRKGMENWKKIGKKVVHFHP